MPTDAALSAPAVWERARDDYLCGDTAAEVCARYGVSRSQFYAQARMGGWRKADQAGAQPLAFAGPPEPEADDGAPAPPTPELAADALRRGARAMARGRLREAQGWIRLAAELRALAIEETPEVGTWLGVLRAARVAAEAPLSAAAPPRAETTAKVAAADDFAAMLRQVGEVGRIARDATALMDAGSDADAATAAQALLARADALLGEAAAAPQAPDLAPPPGLSSGASPVPPLLPIPGAPKVCGAKPDSPDGLPGAAESDDGLPPIPPFRGSEAGPEWPAYCRARAAERPHQTFWIDWAQEAERRLAAGAPPSHPFFPPPAAC